MWIFSPVFVLSELLPVYFSFAFVSSSFSCRDAGFALVVFLWIKVGWFSCHRTLQTKEKLWALLQLVLANVAHGYIFFTELTLPECVDQIQRNIWFFSGLDAGSLLRESAVVCDFLEERGAVFRSGISFKTLRIVTQLVDLSHLQSFVKGRLQQAQKGFHS